MPRARRWLDVFAAEELPAWPHRPWLRDAAMLAVVSLAFAVVCGSYALDVIRSPMPGGWDGMAHYAVASLYADHHFPSVSGWLPDYYAGMPFPNFYPPGLYVLVAAGTKLGLEPLHSFVAVLLGCSYLVPVLTAALTRRLCKSSAAGGLAGVLAVMYMGAASRQAGFGVAFLGSFDIGLASHVVGHCALLAALFFLVDVRKWWSVVGATLALAAVPLCNAHVAWNAVIIGVLWAIGAVLFAAPTTRLPVALRACAIGLVSAMLASVWLAPLASELPYLATMAFGHHRGDAVGLGLMFPLVVLAAALGLAAVRRSALALSVCVANLVVLAIYIAPRLPGFENAPLQPWRLMPPLYFLAPVLAGFCAIAAGPLLRERRLLVLGAVALFAMSWSRAGSYGSGVDAKALREYESVLAQLEDGGRVLVEVGTGTGDVYGLQVMAGLRGHRSLTTVFREASLSAFFAVPLRNRFSETPHMFGLDRKIKPESMLVDSALAFDLDRLRMFGVRYILARSPRVKAIVAEMPEIEALPVTMSGGWQAFELEGKSRLAVVPRYRPALVFSRFSAKRRQQEELEFLRLNEECFLSGPFDLPLVRSKQPFIELENHLERFGSVVVIDYQYRDVEAAFRTLYELSESRRVIVVSARDPLFARLRAASDSDHAIVAVAGAGEVGAERAARAILTAVRDAAQPVQGAPQLADVVDHRHSWTLTLDGDPSEPVPIWVRQSYFPRWQTAGGDEVYMATPAFQLLFATARETRLVYVTGRASSAGALLALLGLMLLALGIHPAARRWWGRAWAG